MQTELQAFRNRSKFSREEWNKRGLNPSDDELCNVLSALFNRCADELLAAVEAGASRGKLRTILWRSLSSVDTRVLDTEEKGFVGDLYAELADIIGIKSGYKLNSWMYGPFLATIVAMKRLLFPERILDTLKQACDKCGVIMEMQILERQDDIPDLAYQVVKCNNCNEFNLLDPGPGIKMNRSVNYQYVESLDKDEYTAEQARIRLEQIRTYRK